MPPRVRVVSRSMYFELTSTLAAMSLRFQLQSHLWSLRNHVEVQLPFSSDSLHSHFGFNFFPIPFARPFQFHFDINSSHGYGAGWLTQGFNNQSKHGKATPQKIMLRSYWKCMHFIVKICWVFRFRTFNYAILIFGLCAAPSEIVFFKGSSQMHKATQSE